MRSAQRLVALLCGAAAMALGTYLYASPIVPNGDFQTGDFTGWNANTGAAVVANSGPAGNGDYAVHLTAADWAFPAFGETTRTISGNLATTYVAAFDVKVDDPSASKQTTVAILRGWSGNYPSYTIVQNDPLFADGAWHTVTWQFTTDADNNNGGSQFAFAVNTGGGGGVRDLWLDNIRIVVAPEPPTFSLLGLSGAGLLLRRKH